MKKKFKKQRKKAAFTLVETLVALALFTIVSTISVSVLLALVDANIKAQDMQIAMTNLSFALDSMTRDIRSGTNYYCTSGSFPGGMFSPNNSSYTDTRNCVNGSKVSFIEGGSSLTESCAANRRRVQFRYTNGAIERALCTNAQIQWKPITSPDINITDMRFEVTGTDSTDDLAPLVKIFIKGEVAGVLGGSTEFAVQTTVTQQLIDV